MNNLRNYIESSQISILKDLLYLAFYFYDEVILFAFKSLNSEED